MDSNPSYVFQVHFNKSGGPDSGRESFVMSFCLGSLFWGCWLSNSCLLRGLASFLCCHLFSVLIHFPCRFANVFWAIPYEVVRTPAPKTTSVFLLVHFYHLGKANDIFYRLIYSLFLLLHLMFWSLHQLKVLYLLLLPTLHQSLLHPQHFQLLQLKWWKDSCPSACMRLINSLGSENILHLIHWLQLSL